VGLDIPKDDILVASFIQPAPVPQRITSLGRIITTPSRFRESARWAQQLEEPSNFSEGFSPES
jgi:hypothetical protein